MKMQDFRFVVIRTVMGNSFPEIQELSDRIYITIYGKNEDEIFRKSGRRMREIAEEYGPDCDPDDVWEGEVRECSEDDLFRMNLYGEDRR